jgi:hypothetical protein
MRFLLLALVLSASGAFGAPAETYPEFALEGETCLRAPITSRRDWRDCDAKLNLKCQLYNENRPDAGGKCVSTLKTMNLGEACGTADVRCGTDLFCYRKKCESKFASEGQACLKASLTNELLQRNCAKGFECVLFNVSSFRNFELERIDPGGICKKIAPKTQ